MLEKAFRQHKRSVVRSWRVDETCIKVKGQWTYLYRAVNNAGQTVDFLLRTHRDKAATQRYFEKSISGRTICANDRLYCDRTQNRCAQSTS
ncbi:hypothetical protein PTKU46_53220 [Paraburkholderia terrae]